MSNISPEDQEWIDRMVAPHRRQLDERLARAEEEAADAQVARLFGATPENPHYRAVVRASAMSDEDRMLLSIGGPEALAAGRAESGELDCMLLLNAALPTEILLLKAGLQLDGTAAPPREVLLFKFGDNPTEKGVLKFTQRSAELIRRQWEKKGRQFGFDYEHGMYDPSVAPADRGAAGWGDLSLRADGLYVENIEWTPRAVQKIADKEFRYLSPALRRGADGEIVAVSNCALTNDPAMLRAPPII